MSAPEDLGVLKYGDIIKLSSEDLTLYSKGPTLSGLAWMEKSSYGNESLCAFRVMPKSISAIPSDQQKNKIPLDGSAPEINQDPSRTGLLKSIHQFSKLSGTPVTIGSNLELQHIISGKYLGVELEVSTRSTNEYLKFRLKDFPDESCLIRVEAIFQFQREKLKVMDGDKVYLEIWVPELHEPIYMYRLEERVFASFENRSRIKLIICSLFTDSNEYMESINAKKESGNNKKSRYGNQIFSWDYIFIKDSENNLNLTLDDDYVVFDDYIDLNSCLWQIETEKPDGVIPEVPYRIRHITKKLYLTLELRLIPLESAFSARLSTSSYKVIENFELVLGDGSSPFSWWSFIPLNPSKSTKFIQSQICKIRNKENGYFLSMSFNQMQKCYPCLHDRESDFVYFYVFKCNSKMPSDSSFDDEDPSRLNENFVNIHDEEVIRDIAKDLNFYKEPQVSPKNFIGIEKVSCAKILLKIFNEIEENQRVFQKLLEMWVEKLQEGNIEVQSAFFSFFTSNQESEHLFKVLSEILLRFTSNMREIMDVENEDYCRVLMFLRLLCENHNSFLQNYLRFQEKSLVSFNFLQVILTFLDNLLKCKHVSVYKSSILCFDTLTELCQGPCKDNQKYLIDSKLIQIVNDLLTMHINTQNNQDNRFFSQDFTQFDSNLNQDSLTVWQITNLKFQAITTVHSLIEGNEDKYIMSRLIRTLNLDAMKENMESIYTSYVSKYGKSYNKKSFLRNEDDQSCPFILELGFLIYHLLRLFQENPSEEIKNLTKDLLPTSSLDNNVVNYLGKDSMSFSKLGRIFSKKDILSYEDKKYEAIRFFEKNSGNIDVVFAGSILCKCYYWLSPECHFLINDVKDEFHYEADRTSDKNKLIYLLSKADDVIDNIQHEYFITKLITRNFVISFILNIRVWRIIAFSDAIILNFLILALYSDYPGDPIDFTLSKFNQTDTKAEYIFHILMLIHIISSIMIFIFYYMKKVPVLFKQYHRKAPQRRYFRSLYGLIMIHIKIETIYVCLYLVMSFLGSFIHVFFFAFHLLDFLYRFPSLQSVIYSLVLPYKSLIMLYFLILISIYLSSIIAYIFYSERFLGNCDSLLLCAVTCYAQGMKNSGGVGYYMYWNDIEVYQNYLNIGQFFFENLFNIIIIIIMFSILTGIIINTFAVLRGMQDENIKDQKNKCFICGLDKNVIEETTKKPFKYHRRYEHNEWYYIFFLLYLRNKKQSEYSGIESMISKEVSKGSVDWIPQEKGYSFNLD
ncbi:hypothetical protein SteCoe_13213 [Stentor coeruleus]|uniref:Uncharacterized protein n=1 Tax=Stentor coeruleus TaxID=5963 RepID=A0A1R2C8W3_9CILI|nr:hypothetical protein SteCoe_13213 [Stentor coeruleus]